MLFSPAPVPAPGIDGALMRFPYQQWIVMPAAAAHVRAAGLPRESLTTVVRAGRRRGVLRTRRDQGDTYVMRIAEAPHRSPAAPRPLP
ncbi:hypothetical protein [Streptomyces similanensis]|uniref:MarR family transcriptional regulator n=1 Tax=Streptomyces similanensis TaxID=1274988 RepID=A0ABP9L733_9ACTN